MNRSREASQKIRVILPVILRIAFSLVLWTLGAATMTLPEEHAKKDHRVGYRPTAIEANEFRHTDET